MLKKLCASFLFLGLLTFVPVGHAADYTVDAAHSNVGFSIPILNGLSRVNGKFSDFTATISYDEAAPAKSSVNAVIKVASIDTGIPNRDKHLLTADFFDGEKFPEITFKSSRVEVKGKELLVHGTFTMHGVSKEIVLPITVTGKITDPATKKTTYGFYSKITLNRMDYGINYERKGAEGFLGKEVEIELNLLTKAPQ
jgi:polyisoprenoid-binding protein YceI